MSSDEEEQDFYDTVQENAFLANVFDSSGSARRFLERMQRVFVRGITLDSSASDVWLKYETDIDGCVIEINDLAGVKLPVRHLNVCPRGVGSLRQLNSVLKKHVHLTQYSADALKNFHNSVGFQLFYEHGWECWLGLMPDTSARVYALTKEVIRVDALGAFEKFRCDLQTELSQYAANGVAVRTLAKNDLSDLRRIFVLADDCSKLLAAVQSAVSKIAVQHFKPVVFCFRFGEKMTAGISLSDFRADCIEKVTVHAAVDIACNTDGIELLWSRGGIQEVVGCRGTLSPCLSLFDCGNFQSNLDGKAMDIKPELRRVFCSPGKVTFVQLYADLPHMRPQTRVHPVSGIIAGGLCFPTNMALAFRRDAKKYISVMANNFGLLRSSTCRLEGVCELSEYPDIVKGSDLIDVNRLASLLGQKSLLAPIPSATLSCIRAVGLWLCEELSDMLSYNTTGNVRATWRAFQCELAVEKMLWGHPLSQYIGRYSINLGPGVVRPSRSRTDELGFLALEEPTTCMATEYSIPPTSIWVASVGLGKSIGRVAGLHDHIDASYPVIGQMLILALLKDLHSTGKMLLRFEDFLAFLKDAPSPSQIVGAVTLEALTTLLGMKRRNAVFMVFGKLCGLLNKHRLPCQQIVKAGLREMGLTKFPAVETYDTHGNAVLKWDRKMMYWKVLPSSQAGDSSVTLWPELYSQLAKGALETRGLIFPSRLKKLPALWPWIEPCLRKLDREKLDGEATITTLAFVSALAFLMQGWFVDFDRFAQLYEDLPVQQFRLKTLQIQSRLLLSSLNFKNLRIFRLHDSIPHQLPIAAKIQEPALPDESLPQDQPIEETGNRISQDEDVAESAQLVENIVSTCEPVGCVKPTWTSEELEILDEVRSNQDRIPDMYVQYQQMCMMKKVPFRPFTAFKRKIIRRRVHYAVKI